MREATNGSEKCSRINRIGRIHRISFLVTGSTDSVAAILWHMLLILFILLDLSIPACLY